MKSENERNPKQNPTEQKSTEILHEFDRQKYKEVVNLIGKMIVDKTLAHDDEESNPLPEIQQ